MKSSLLLLIHSRPFLFLLLPYFIATVSLVHFLFLFSWVRRRQNSTRVTCYLSFIIINFRGIEHAIRLDIKNTFYAEGIKHGVKAVTPSVNHTIGIRNSERRLVIESTGWGGPTSTRREKQGLSFSRGDGQRLFLTLWKV